MSRSHLVEVNISIVPTDSRWDGNTDRPKSLSKATLKKRFVNNYSQNVFFFWYLLCYANRCFQTKGTGSRSFLCLPFRILSIKSACKLYWRAQQATLKITERLPSSSAGNQLKLSCFPYSLLIMQMDPLKETATHILQVERTHVVHADASIAYQGLPRGKASHSYQQ